MYEKKLGKLIKKKIKNYLDSDKKLNKSKLLEELKIKRQYLNDLENGRRVQSNLLMKRMIIVLKLNKKEEIELYELASHCKSKNKIPADIEEYILKNSNAKDEIRELMSRNKSKEIK